MHFIKKDLSLLIVATSYWRFKFISRLFRSHAHIKLIVIEQPSDIKVISDEGFDVVIWELELGLGPPCNLDKNKIILASYRDESYLPDLKAAAKKWGLSTDKLLQLVVDKSADNVFPLPLPPPRIKKQYLGSPKKLSQRSQDLFFLCSPTFIYMDEEVKLPYTSEINKRWCYNQRLEWVTELYEKKRLPEGQGLIETDIEYLSAVAIKEKFQFKLPCYVTPLDSKAYSRAMLESKLILCPGGHSRWTYRHFEGFFNRGLVVSTDFRQVRTTPDIPGDAIISIDDGQFSLEKIDEILGDIDRLQTVADHGYQFARELLIPKSQFRKAGYKSKAIDKMFNQFFTWISDTK